MTCRHLIAAALAAVAGASAAQADSVHYTFTYTGNGSGVSAVGSLTLNGIGCATSGSITISGTAADGTYALATYQYPPDGLVHFAQDTVSSGFYYDNNLYCEHETDPEQHLSSFGLLFTNYPSSSALFNININFNGSNYSMVSTFQTINDNGTFECSKVPAPGALAIAGLAGLVGSRRRRA